MPVLYPRADQFCSPAHRVTSLFSTVVYHAKNSEPSFCDEFKLDLPTVIDPTDHILFTFYNVSCKPAAKDGKRS